MIQNIYGHKKQIDFLNKSIESGKLAHAYLFSGPAFVGKRSLAKKFAYQLLGSDRQENFHPDFLEVGGEETIKIERIRELVYKLALKPYQAKYKVAVIDNAENMTDEAQNSLLKAFEEPKPYTIIILITANPGKLLRTISSRAQKMNFGPVRAEDYKPLIPSGLDDETAGLILDMAAGRPGLARTISADSELVEKLKQINLDFGIMHSSDLPEKLKLAYDLAGLETADLKQVLDFLLIKYEATLVENPDLKNVRNIAQVNQSRKFLDQNVNSKLLLTNLMLNLN